MNQKEYRPHQTNLPEQAGIPATQEAITLRAPLVQEEPGSDDTPHEGMVATIRREIEQERADRARHGYNFDPVEFLGSALSWEFSKRHVAEHRDSEERDLPRRR